MAQWFIPWFGQVQHLPIPRCGVPTNEGCNQPLSSGPKTHLNTTVFCFHFTISRLRGISTTWSLSPLHFEVHKEARSKGGMSDAHKTQNQSTNTHTSHNKSSQHNPASSQRIKCAESKSWCLGMLRECLLCFSMRLGVPFIAPRQLGAVECIPGRQFLPSVA
jgi:hypothetical protein